MIVKKTLTKRSVVGKISKKTPIVKKIVGKRSIGKMSFVKKPLVKMSIAKKAIKMPASKVTMAKKATPKKTFKISLAFQKFKKTLEAEIRYFWQINSSIIYTERWWNSIEESNWPIRLSEYPGDKKNPFNSIDMPVSEYLKLNNQVANITIENSIVSFITTFEVYLLDITRRMLFLDPEIIGDSTMPFEAKEIAFGLTKHDALEWFSNCVASKYMRNKTHLKMLKRMETLAKMNLFKTYKTIVDEWDKWTYVRNAIVHCGREVTDDLVRIWSDRFPVINSKLNLTDRDVVRVHYLALEIAKKIDTRVIENNIKDEDGFLLIKELFVRFGDDNPSEVSQKIYKILNQKLNKNVVSQQIASQKKSNSKISGWFFSKYNFEE